MGEAQLCIAQVRRNASTDLTELTARHAAILDAIAKGNPTPPKPHCGSISTVAGTCSWLM